MQPHVPTSVTLAHLLSQAPQNVSLAWLFDHLQKRSFGFVMLLLALVGLVPGVGIFIGILLAFPAIQMVLGHETPTLPHFLTTRRIATRHIAVLATRTIPLLKRMETLIRPRWHTPWGASIRYGVGCSPFACPKHPTARAV